MDRIIRPSLDPFGLWVGRGLYRVTPAVTAPRFFGSHPEDRLHLVALYDKAGMLTRVPANKYTHILKMFKINFDWH